MTQPRYFLPDHPALTEVYSKSDLRAMLHSGELSRSDMVLDDETGLAHLLGDLLAAPYPDATNPPVRTTTGHAPAPPLRHEFRADTPLTPSRPYEHDLEEDDDDDLDEEDIKEEATDGDDATTDLNETEDVKEAEENDPQESLARHKEPPTPAEMLPSRGGEEILYLGHPSWFAYPKSVLASLSGYTLAVLAHQYQYGLEWTVLLASVATLVLLFVSLDRTTTTYFITTRRVEIEYGLVGRNSKEVRIADVRAIDVQQKAYAAFTGIGSVDFDSAAGTGAEIHFKDVRRPHEIKQLVRELQG